MTLTISSLLILLAFVLVIVSAIGRAPLWIAVFLLALERLIGVFGIR